MIVFEPIDVTDAVMTASNVTEDDHADWSDLTAYVAGDYAISTATHTVYRCLVDHTDEDPDAEQVALNDPLIADPSPIHWQVISATNRWKAFDQKPSAQTTNADTITYALNPGELVTGIGFFNVDADTIQVTVTDPSDGLVYDHTIDMIDTTVVIDWFTYFFEPFAVLNEAVLIDLPPYSMATIGVTITKTGGTAGVGEIAFGNNRELGYVELRNSGFSGLDFSYVQNDEFGNLDTVVRQATRLAEYDVVVPTLRLLSVDSILRGLRGGQPAVWIGDTDSRKAALAYGYHKSYRAIYAEGDETLLNIQVQGLV